MGIPIATLEHVVEEAIPGIVVVLGIPAKAHNTEENFIECFDGVQR